MSITLPLIPSYGEWHSACRTCAESLTCSPPPGQANVNRHPNIRTRPTPSHSQFASRITYATPAQARMSAMHHTPISIIASCTITNPIHIACIPFPFLVTILSHPLCFRFCISRLSRVTAYPHTPLLFCCCGSSCCTTYQSSNTAQPFAYSPSILRIASSHFPVVRSNV